MPVKFDGNIKLDINVAITASFMIYFLIANNATQEEISEIKPQIEKIPKEVKNQSRADIINILQQIEIKDNNTKLTQDQILQYSKQILREVR